MAQPTSFTIDMRLYNDRMQKGAISLQRIGPNVHQLIVRNYDPADGKELEPQVLPINAEGLELALEQAQEQYNEVEASLNSLKKLKADMLHMEQEKISVFTITPDSSKSAG